MLTALPELALNHAVAITAAMRSHRLSPDDAFFVVLQGHDTLLHCRSEARACLDGGLSGQEAEMVFGVLEQLASSQVELFEAAFAVYPGASAELRARAETGLAEARTIQEKAQKLLKQLAGPPAPLPDGFLAQAKAAWQRGEGMDAEEMLARRKARKG
jgi:hypothetical protein